MCSGRTARAPLAPFEHDAPFEQNVPFEHSALLFAELSDEVRCAPARFIWICLEARGCSREEFVDLVSRQNILHDEKVAECFEKGKTGISGNFRAGRSVKGHGFAPGSISQLP
jgi:hypothetical protein